MSTRLGDSITALLGILRTGSTGALIGSNNVIDGPTLSGDDPDVAVYVGYDGDPTGEYKATENWSGAFTGLPQGRQVREESFEIVCSVIAQSGDVDPAPTRVAALAALSAVEDDLRANIDLGLGVGIPTFAQLALADMYQEQDTENGTQVRIPFRVGVVTRI